MKLPCRKDLPLSPFFASSPENCTSSLGDVTHPHPHSYAMMWSIQKYDSESPYGTPIIGPYSKVETRICYSNTFGLNLVITKISKIESPSELHSIKATRLQYNVTFLTFRFVKHTILSSLKSIVNSGHIQTCFITMKF